MIASMTAFAHKSLEEKWGIITWEIRSVNHRYLEVNLRIPEMFRQLEPAMRELAQKHLKRGKVEATLKFIPGSDMPFNVEVNEALLQQLAKINKIVMLKFPHAQVNVTDVLQWPGIIQTKETQMQVVNAAIIDLLSTTLNEMVAVRSREGNTIEQFLFSRIEFIQKEIASVETRTPIAQQIIRDKIASRVAELSLEVDKDRAEQEVLFLVQKSDIAEEIQRIKAHLDETKRVLNKGGVVGRRLDFLMQELNREANTLSAKSSDLGITQSAIELKVLIEQMREQVQNLE